MRKISSFALSLFPSCAHHQSFTRVGAGAASCLPVVRNMQQNRHGSMNNLVIGTVNSSTSRSFVSSLFKRSNRSVESDSSTRILKDKESLEEEEETTIENKSIILYNSKYNNLVHKFIIQPYQINKTHILNALATTGMLYTVYELDININWFLCCLWVMGSSYLSYSSHINNINHKICVLTKLDYDSKNKVLYLYDDSGNIVDRITDFRNLILDSELGFKVHMPLAGFFWKSFLLNRTDMADRFTLKFLNYNVNEVKARVKYQDFGILKGVSERMKKDAITTIDPETGVMKQYVYMIVNSNPQVIKELREDLLDLKQQHGVKSKW